MAALRCPGKQTKLFVLESYWEKKYLECQCFIRRKLQIALHFAVKFFGVSLIKTFPVDVFSMPQLRHFVLLLKEYCGTTAC